MWNLARKYLTSKSRLLVRKVCKRKIINAATARIFEMISNRCNGGSLYLNTKLFKQNIYDYSTRSAGRNVSAMKIEKVPCN
jgi:hypothetical protein